MWTDLILSFTLPIISGVAFAILLTLAMCRKIYWGHIFWSLIPAGVWGLILFLWSKISM